MPEYQPTIPRPPIVKGPRAWIDEQYVPRFRADISIDDVRELAAIMSQAFGRGLEHGYSQATRATWCA